MGCSVKKAKVDGDQSSKPIKSSLYEARMENVVPNDLDLLEVQKSHPHYGLLEIKCPYTHRNITPLEAEKSDSGFCLSESNEILKLNKSHQYFRKVQGQMAVCGAKWCDSVVYTFKGMHLERVLYNDAYWSEQLTKLETFYFCFPFYIMCSEISSGMLNFVVEVGPGSRVNSHIKFKL